MLIPRVVLAAFVLAPGLGSATNRAETIAATRAATGAVTGWHVARFTGTASHRPDDPLTAMKVAALVQPSSTDPGPAPAPDPVEGAPSSARDQACPTADTPKGGEPVHRQAMALAGPGRDGSAQRMHPVRPLHAEQPREDFIPAFACPVIDVLGAPIRDTHVSDGGRLIQSSAPEVVDATTLRLAIRPDAGLPLMLDIYQANGTVQHATVRPTTEPDGRINVVATLAKPLPAGVTVVVPVTGIAPARLGPRPPSERTDTYVAALREALQNTSNVAADLMPFDVHPQAMIPAAAAIRASRPAGTAMAPTAAARPPRCGAILDRAQLGEILTEADQAFLRTACR